MANPVWTTGNNVKTVNLGTVTEGAYFDYPVVAYDPNGGPVSYKFLAGTLPPGIRVSSNSAISTGYIQGGPLITDVANQTRNFEFTVRATDQHGLVSDKSFAITIANIVPPEITPRVTDLGQIFDGDFYNKQLEAIELNPNANLTWTLTSGSLPPGVSLSTSGLISGFVLPISTTTTVNQGYNVNPYNEFAYENSPVYQNNTFKFTVNVFDGANYDTLTYQIYVVSKSDYSADTTSVKIDDTYLTIDQDNRYVPIMTTPSQALPEIRSNSKFAYQFQAIDPNGLSLTYSLGQSSQAGGFDQNSNDNQTLTYLYLNLNNNITVSSGDVLSQGISSGNAATSSTGNTVTISGSSLQPNISVYLTPFSSNSAYLLNNSANTGALVNSVSYNWTYVPDSGMGQGFDTHGFDQENLSVPPGIAIDPTTGWLAGTIGGQVAAVQNYNFQVYAYETAFPTRASAPVTYTMTVLGDISNNITWTTAANLGIIDNGTVSEFSVSAVNHTGRALTYSLVSDSSRLPQGLELQRSGLIVGRTTFDFFSLDHGTTTVDEKISGFDNSYSFTVQATTTDGTASSQQTFTILVNNYNLTPYENVYLKALTTVDQRNLFLSIVDNNDIFPGELIYRSTDPWFGRARDIRSLFLAGLAPTAVNTYLSAISTNTYNKRIDFSNIKTAQAVDANFNVKYEVVYVELEDTATYNGNSPANSRYDTVIGKTVYPNSFKNMSSVVTAATGYANPGAMPEWMTSPQANKKTLGFTRAIVLAYTVPGASKLIAYRLQANGIAFNNINFIADRYDLDNALTANYDLVADEFIPGLETTFDRIVRPGAITTSVTYGVTGLAFDQINNQTVSAINALGGLDGITNFATGDTVIFLQQENYGPAAGTNDGWTRNGSVIPGWNEFVNSTKIPSTTSGFPANPILGQTFLFNNVYYQFTADYDRNGNLIDTVWKVADLRANVWQISISNSNVVTLTPVLFLRKTGSGTNVNQITSSISANDRVQVNRGLKHSESIVYYNSVLVPGNSVPAYTVIPTVLATSAADTRFDNYGTRFINNRDVYAAPEVGDTWLKFPAIGPLLT